MKKYNLLLNLLENRNNAAKKLTEFTSLSRPLVKITLDDGSRPMVVIPLSPGSAGDAILSIIQKELEGTLEIAEKAVDELIEEIQSTKELESK